MQTSTAQPPSVSQPISQTAIGTNPLNGLLLLVLPLTLALSIRSYRKARRAHQERQAILLRQQVEMLEKIWRMSPSR